MARPKFLLLGDSLTQLSFSGWAAHLADVYQRRIDVISRGMSGYNTDWYLRYMNEHQVLDETNVALITIFFGANDSSDVALNPHHHVPLDRFKSNLLSIISKCRHQFGESVPIVVIGCPPVHHEQRLAYQKERYGDAATGKLERSMALSQQYSSAAQEVAEKSKLPCLNLWQEMTSVDTDLSEFFCDGLHFTREGNEFVGLKLVELMNSTYPRLAVTPCPITGQWANSASSCPSLAQSGPYHDEINHLDPSAAFDNQKEHPN